MNELTLLDLLTAVLKGVVTIGGLIALATLFTNWYLDCPRLEDQYYIVADTVSGKIYGRYHSSDLTVAYSVVDRLAMHGVSARVLRDN